MGTAHPLTLLGNAGAPGAAQTTALTTIASIADAHTTPDYAIAATTNSSAYGFAGANEIISFIYIVQNLQVRLAALESKLQAQGIIL
jgi:hypothetical protein